MKDTTMEELSAGGVVYRKAAQAYEYLIGKHSGYHKWVLPKGLVEKGESMVETATREVAEEAGVGARVVDMRPIETIEYYYFADLDEKMGMSASGEVSTRRVTKYQEEGGKKVRVHKRVVFYLMEYESEIEKGKGWEMEEIRWVDFAQANQMLAFESERKVLALACASDQN